MQYDNRNTSGQQRNGLKGDAKRLQYVEKNDRRKTNLMILRRDKR